MTLKIRITITKHKHEKEKSTQDNVTVINEDLEYFNLLKKKVKKRSKDFIHKPFK